MKEIILIQPNGEYHIAHDATEAELREVIGLLVGEFVKAKAEIQLLKDGIDDANMERNLEDR